MILLKEDDVKETKKAIRRRPYNRDKALVYLTAQRVVLGGRKNEVIVLCFRN